MTTPSSHDDPRQATVSISLRDVRFTWRGASSPVITIDTFTVAHGERVFLYGPSGSGKSTLLSLLAGVQIAQSGQVQILGQDLKTLSAGRRDRFRADTIGYIFQQFNLLPFMDVLGNVTLACQFSPARRRRLQQAGLDSRAEAHRLLERLGIDPSMHHRPASQLSVGQQQRVAAARALLGAPPILIADEPTSALDADSREEFLQLIFEECDAAAITLIFVSHDQGLRPLFHRSINLPDINQALRGVS